MTTETTLKTIDTFHYDATAIDLHADYDKIEGWALKATSVKHSIPLNELHAGALTYQNNNTVIRVRVLREVAA